MENYSRTVKIYAKEIKKDKQTFIVCSGKIGENYYKIKFRKTCKNAPDEVGVYDLTVNLKDCSIEKGKPYTDSETKKQKIGQATIWVEKIEELRKYSDEELREISLKNLKEIFD